ncbi:M23 family metallopeptidase [Sphingomonas sp. GlSt437]|uniref:M23 family metallopeptidase n=1 Tax=Sphingomonas sp. GlSt437 TaxID=3389970 RepID=UPI003A8BDA9A
MKRASRSALLALTSAAMLAQPGTSQPAPTHVTTAKTMPALPPLDPRPQPATKRATPDANGFILKGPMTQGGAIIGHAPAGTVALSLDGAPVPLTPDGRFLIAFDRDAKPIAVLVARLASGGVVTDPLTISPRGWDISRLPTLPKYPVPEPEFAKIRPAELAQINAARAMVTDAHGWDQPFLWPALGRISTLFGSQRIFANGEAGSYHSGTDVAVPIGTPVFAPADGVVILAADHPYSLEGNLLMVDHGMGLSSAFLHLSQIEVKVGEHVKRGQEIARSGMTGRATGPHLHWSLKWREAKIDPLLMAGPMLGLH